MEEGRRMPHLSEDVRRLLSASDGPSSSSTEACVDDGGWFDWKVFESPPPPDGGRHIKMEEAQRLMWMGQAVAERVRQSGWPTGIEGGCSSRSNGGALLELCRAFKEVDSCRWGIPQ
jgi:hypothetical protein